MTSVRLPSKMYVCQIEIGEDEYGKGSPHGGTDMHQSTLLNYNTNTMLHEIDSQT